MLLFTCQTGYITRNPSNIHKVNNVIVCHLALLGGKGLRHLKRHMVIQDAMFNCNKVILNYIPILRLDYLLIISIKTAYLSWSKIRSTGWLNISHL